MPDLARLAHFQADGGTSAATLLPLAEATAAALVVLGWRRGWYLFVPALWPANQIGYSLVSLPLLGAMPFVAAAISAPVPYLGPVAIIAMALVGARRRAAALSMHPPAKVGT